LSIAQALLPAALLLPLRFSLGKRAVSFSARRAKHFGHSEMMRDVQPFAQKYLAFRKTETVL
jgi:hypothetical protein